MARTHVGSLLRLFRTCLMSSLEKNPIVAYIIVFWIISGDFLFYIDKVCCAYSLESPR